MNFLDVFILFVLLCAFFMPIYVALFFICSSMRLAKATCSCSSTGKCEVVVPLSPDVDQGDGQPSEHPGVPMRSLLTQVPSFYPDRLGEPSGSSSALVRPSTSSSISARANAGDLGYESFSRQAVGFAIAPSSEALSRWSEATAALVRDPSKTKAQAAEGRKLGNNILNHFSSMVVENNTAQSNAALVHYVVPPELRLQYSQETLGDYCEWALYLMDDAERKRSVAAYFNVAQYTPRAEISWN